MLYFISDINDNKVGLVRSWTEDEFTLFGRHESDFEKDNKGFFVDEIPDKEDREGFNSALMFDGKDLWWEYTPNSETEPHLSELDLLKAQNKALSDRLEFMEDLFAEMAMKVYAE